MSMQHSDIYQAPDAPLRVLMLAPAVGLGGADTGVIDWCSHAGEAGIAPYLLTTQFGQDNSRFADAAQWCHAAHALPESLRPAAIPAAILRFIDEHEIQLVHLMNSKVGFDLLPHLNAIVPTVVQFHNEERSGRGFPRHVASRFDAFVNAYSVISTDMQLSLERHGVPATKIHRILLGVDPEQYRTLTSARQHRRILWAGRLSYQKRPELLIDIAQELQRRESPIHIDVVGSGEQAADLAASIHLEHLESTLTLHGDQHDMSPYYERAGAVLLTSRYEGIPRVIYEAFAAARPVIAPSVGGIPELLTPTSGVLLDPAATVAEYCDAIIDLVAAPERREQLGDTARQRVIEIGTVRQMVSDHAAMYRTLIDSFSPSSDAARTRPGVASDAVPLILTREGERTHIRSALQLPHTESPIAVIGFVARNAHGDSIALSDSTAKSTLGHGTFVPLPNSLEWNEAIGFAHWRAEQVAGHALTAPEVLVPTTSEAVFVDHPLLGGGAPSGQVSNRDLQTSVICDPNNAVATLIASALKMELEGDGIAAEITHTVTHPSIPVGGIIIVGEHPVLDSAMTEPHPILQAAIFIGTGPMDTPLMNRAAPRLRTLAARFHLDPQEANALCALGIPTSPLSLDLRRSIDRTHGVPRDIPALFIGEVNEYRSEALANLIAEDSKQQWHISIRDSSIPGVDAMPLITSAAQLSLLLARAQHFVCVPWAAERPGDYALTTLAVASGATLSPDGAVSETSEPSLPLEARLAPLRGAVEVSTAIREVIIASHQNGEWAHEAGRVSPAPPPDTTRPKKALQEKRSRLESQLLRRRLDAAHEPAHVQIAATDTGTPTLTVVVTAFGKQMFVEECLDSIVTSSEHFGQPITVILDTDGDLAVFDHLRSTLPGRTSSLISWHLVDPGRNRGLAAARNASLELVTTPLVGILDADDRLLPQALHDFTEALERSPEATFVYGLLTLFGSRVGLANKFPWDPKRLVHGNYIASIAAFRTDRLRAAGGYTPEMNDRFGGWEDYELWCRLASRGEFGIYLPTPVAQYRQMQTSMVSTMDLDVWSAMTHLQHRYPRLPWPYRLPATTNTGAIPNMESLGDMSERAARRLLRRRSR